MRKSCQLFVGLATVALLLGLSGRFHPVLARMIGTNPTGVSADVWCEGGRIRGNTVIAFTEICQDSNGDLIPTSTSNTSTLGTAALPWDGLFLAGTGNIITNTGGSTLGAPGTANTLGTGNATNPTSLTLAGNLVLTPSQVGTSNGQNTGINVSTTIPVNTSYELLLSSGSNIKLTSTPTIATTTTPGGAVAIADGTYLVLTSTDNNATITLQSNGTLSGSLLRLGSSTRAITQGNILTLIFNQKVGQWVEAAFSAGSGN